MAMGRAAKGHAHGTSLPWQLTQLEAQGIHSTSLLQSTESTDCHHDPVFTRIQIGRYWVRCDSWCQLGEAAAEAMHLSLTPQLTSLGDCADWAKLWQQDSLSQHPVEHLHEMNLYQNVLKCQYQARVTFEACSWAKVLERALHSSASRALCDALWRTSRSSCFFPGTTSKRFATSWSCVQGSFHFHKSESASGSAVAFARSFRQAWAEHRKVARLNTMASRAAAAQAASEAFGHELDVALVDASLKGDRKWKLFFQAFPGGVEDGDLTSSKGFLGVPHKTSSSGTYTNIIQHPNLATQ